MEKQYVLLNRQIPGGKWRLSSPDSIQKEDFDEIKTRLPENPESNIKIGTGIVISYLNSHDENLVTITDRFLKFAEETDTPVIIQLDGENWWSPYPELWNWWDTSRKGYNPDNRHNVEWYGWTPDKAIKIAWRNWGRQIRVLPPPNLMSPIYQELCRSKLNLIIPIIYEWWRALPLNKQDLFIGIKVGHESSIGVNAWYYPDGNALLDCPESEDPNYGVKVDDTPSRGVVQIGYSAVKTAGIRSDGDITEADLAQVIQRHLEYQSRIVSEHGIPRDKIFTHCGGWKKGELLFNSAVNEYSCPGWSFYGDGAYDPKPYIGNIVSGTDAPYWAAVEWLYNKSSDETQWINAINNTLGVSRCRFLCVYNWEGIKGSDGILKAIRKVVQ